jgi:hypothetical protein
VVKLGRTLGITCAKTNNFFLSPGFSSTKRNTLGD